MKKKLNFSKFNISVHDVIFLIAVTAVFIYAVLASPAHSIADQGDFERVMRPCGLDFPDGEYSFYDFAHRFYKLSFTKIDLMLYLPRLLFIVPTTSFIFPTAAARLICMPFGAFDVRVLSIIMFVWYSAVCMLILKRITLKNIVFRYIFTAVFVLIFFNGINLTMFNSLYGQSVMLTSFATVILGGLMLFDGKSQVKKKTIVFFSVASCMLLGAKLQCVVFVPFLVGAIFTAAKKGGFKKTGIICMAFVMWYGIGGYIINGGQLNMDTQYNSVFYGILKDSANPTEDLRFLDIDEDMTADAGKHAYLQESEYKFAPRTDITKEKFHSKMNNGKLIKFYISHPLRLIGAMQNTAESSFSNRINLGTFEKKYGFDPQTSDYRFDIWENFRSSLSGSLAFITAVWCLFLIESGIMIKRKNPLGIPFAAILLMGALQFPMPYMGNGAADISKQLFLFNTVFDIGLTVMIYAAILTIDGKVRK